MVLTRILNPAQFTADVLAPLLKVNEGTARYVLEQMGERGIVDGFRILQPSKFTPLTVALLIWTKERSAESWEMATQDARLIALDQAEYALEALTRRGIVE